VRGDLPLETCFAGMQNLRRRCRMSLVGALEGGAVEWLKWFCCLHGLVGVPGDVFFRKRAFSFMAWPALELREAFMFVETQIDCTPEE